MEIADLRTFLVIARLANLRAAADVLHRTPSALSKSVRRLEDSLGTALFDRIGKSLRLNAEGDRFATRATELVALADATAAEFQGRPSPHRCRVAGPAILNARFGPALAEQLADQQQAVRLDFSCRFEDDALTALGRGEADLALVTAVALAQAAPAGILAVPLGQVRMQLAVGGSHALGRRARVSMVHVLQHDFACIDRSPFCGLARAGRSDGWRDDEFPRRIQYWVDDLDLLLALVAQGVCLAYAPDFALARRADLRRLTVTDCPFECVEDVHAVVPARQQQRWTPVLRPLAVSR